MAKVEDCPGFETFGADVKAAREARRLARKTLAEMVGIEWRYLANIENQGAIRHYGNQGHQQGVRYGQWGRAPPALSQ